MSVFVKKMRVYPIGDAEEVNRVYDYIRDGMYVQYKLMNKLMSQVATLYYSEEVNRDIKSDVFKAGCREIYRISNPIYQDEAMPKGLGMQSIVTQKVRQDFSTALKNGLASGNRSVPYYRRGTGLLAPGARFSFYMDDDTYCIKFCNGIHFKVIMGRGKNDQYLLGILTELVANNEAYSVGTSQLLVDGKYIYLYLTVKINNDTVKVNLNTNKTMGVAFGYESPVVCCIQDTSREEPEVIYTELGDSTILINKREKIQSAYKNLQRKLSDCAGGRGRKHKLQALNRRSETERNFVRTYNHKISKEIIELALENNVSEIIVEQVEKQELTAIMLRNWSWYELQSMIEYKAKKYGIAVHADNRKVGRICSKCGCEIAENIDYNTKETFQCPECGNELISGQNKALVLATVRK